MHNTFVIHINVRYKITLTALIVRLFFCSLLFLLNTYRYLVLELGETNCHRYISNLQLDSTGHNLRVKNIHNVDRYLYVRRLSKTENGI